MNGNKDRRSHAPSQRLPANAGSQSFRSFPAPAAWTQWNASTEAGLRSSFERGYRDQWIPSLSAPLELAAAPLAPRRLTALFRRDPRWDGQKDRVRYEGYQILWPDGAPMSLGFERFCQQGCRLLGLGKRMGDRKEQLVNLCIHPIEGLQSPLTRPAPGVRCRRFYLERQSSRGQLFFFNGSPTDMVFDLHRDDPRVLDWLGLEIMNEGDCQWFDLSAESVA